MTAATLPHSAAGPPGQQTRGLPAASGRPDPPSMGMVWTWTWDADMEMHIGILLLTNVLRCHHPDRHDVGGTVFPLEHAAHRHARCERPRPAARRGADGRPPRLFATHCASVYACSRTGRHGGVPLRLLLTASNANVGGSGTAMAMRRSWAGRIYSQPLPPAGLLLPMSDVVGCAFVYPFSRQLSCQDSISTRCLKTVMRVVAMTAGSSRGNGCHPTHPQRKRNAARVSAKHHCLDDACATL